MHLPKLLPRHLGTTALLLAALPALAGEIRGTVKYAGPEPKLAPLAITKDQGACGPTTPDDSLVVSGGKLANTVVVVKGLPARPEAKSLVLDQEKCRYRPHVQAAAKGSSLDILNSDPVLHNSHGYLGQATAFNVAIPMKNQKVSKKLDKLGPVKVKCDVHPWMSAYVVVVDGPSAVSGPDGAFTIADVPPGTYTVTAWHEKLGEKSAQVTVPASGAATLELSFGG